MKKALHVITLIVIGIGAWLPQSAAQDKKLERIRIGGGAVGAPQMTMWFAKEANLYEKHGLAVEAIHIPGSSLALQAMLSGEYSARRHSFYASQFGRRRYRHSRDDSEEIFVLYLQ